MEIYQFIAPAIAVYYIVRIFDQIRTKRNFIFTSVMWLGFWILITALSITPHDFSTKLAQLLGFRNNTNTIIFIVMAFLIVLSFYLSSKTERLETQVTNLVRQLALDERRIKELESRKKMKVVSKQSEKSRKVE